MGYKELYNIHSYFSGPSKSMLKSANITQAENVAQPEGHQHANRDEELRQIAKAGREWKFTMGRWVDMESMYCLCELRDDGTDQFCSVCVSVVHRVGAVVVG